MLQARANWLLLWKWFRREEPRRSFCSKSTNKSNGDKAESSLTKYDEAYRQLDKLDFMTAAKILFTESPKKKKFGLDFHLVQFFFVCMPSLAVYLVAQYARYEMRRMEAELEQKKKKEEEEKAKAMELKDTEATETGPIPELLEVKVRLDKLEETMKEIVVESKKQASSDLMKNQEDINGKKPLAATEASSKEGSSESGKSIGKHLESRPDLGQGRTSGSAPVSDTSLQDQKSQNHD